MNHRTPHGGLRPVLVALFVVTLATLAPGFTPAAIAAPSCSLARQAFPLHAKTAGHAASCGKNVAALQWLLHGGKPYAMHQVKPTFKQKPNGAYGAITKHDVLAMKFRIGYPKAHQCRAKTTLLRDTTSRYFFFILEGKAKRPLCWVGLAADRVKGTVRTGPTKTALGIQSIELSQLGVHEIPNGSNRGPCISATYGCFKAFSATRPYQSSTGKFGAAWCASFGDWALITVTGHGFGSPNDAYVPAIAEYARVHNWLAAKPKVGSFAVFLSSDLQLVNAFHIGYVVKVTASGVQTIEGNSGSAYGGSVREVWRTFTGNHMVYVNVPGVA